MEDLKLRFNDNLQKVICNSNDRSNIFTGERYDQILAEVKEAKLCKSNGDTISSKQRRRLKRYDILKIGQSEKLIERRTDQTSEFRYFCTTDELFDIVHSAHIGTGHKRMQGMSLFVNSFSAEITCKKITYTGCDWFTL